MCHEQAVPAHLHKHVGQLHLPVPLVLHEAGHQVRAEAVQDQQQVLRLRDGQPRQPLPGQSTADQLAPQHNTSDDYRGGRLATFPYYFMHIHVYTYKHTYIYSGYHAVYVSNVLLSPREYKIQIFKPKLFI